MNDVVVIALGQGEGGVMGSGEQVEHHGCSGAVGDLVVGPRGGGREHLEKVVVKLGMVVDLLER